MKISHKEKAEILFLFVSFPTPLSLSLSLDLKQKKEASFCWQNKITFYLDHSSQRTGLCITVHTTLRKKEIFSKNENVLYDDFSLVNLYSY